MVVCTDLKQTTGNLGIKFVEVLRQFDEFVVMHFNLRSGF